MERAATLESAVTSATALALGLGLLVSCFLLDYEPGDAGANVTVCGTTIAGLSAVRAAAPARAPILSWLTVAIGVWLGLSAVMFEGSFAAGWAVGAGGPVVAVLALCSIAASSEAASLNGSSA